MKAIRIRSNSARGPRVNWVSLHSPWVLVFLLAVAGAASGQALEGTWSGTATDSRAKEGTFPVSMILDGSGNGQINYPSYNCGGTLTFLSQTGASYHYRESLTSGVKACIDGGEVTVIPNGDSLQWTWRGGGVSATATLSGHRVQNSPTGCISAAKTLRTKDGFYYWNFANSCKEDHMVHACVDGLRLSINVPAKQSADIVWGVSSSAQDLSFEVDTPPVHCPRQK